MSQDDPSVCDFTVTLDARGYKFNEHTTNYEVILSLRSDDCILQFPSKVFDVQELTPSFELPMLMPFAHLIDQMTVQITEITLYGEAQFTHTQLEVADFPNDHPKFEKLNVSLDLCRQYSGDLVQFMALHNTELSIETDMTHGDLWVEIETQYFSVRSRYKKGITLRNLFIPDAREFILKIQYRFAGVGQEEFVTLQTVRVEKSSSVQKGHRVALQMDDYVDERLFVAATMLLSNGKSIPSDFLSEMFCLQDVNFDEFQRTRKYVGQNRSSTANFRTKLVFVLSVSLPVASKKMEFTSMSLYANKARGEAGSLLLMGIDGDFDYACISTTTQELARDVTEYISLSDKRVYKVRLESENPHFFRVIPPLLGGDYYNSFPNPIAQKEHALSQLLTETTAIRVYVYSGNSIEMLNIDFPAIESDLISCCAEQKDYVIYFAQMRVIFGASQRDMIRKNSSALISSRFKNHSLEAGIFGSHSYSSIANYSSTTNSAECQNYQILISVDLSRFTFHVNATHYAVRLELTFSNLIIELCEVLKEVHEKKVELSAFLPVQFEEAEFSFDLNIVQFDGDAFTLFSDQTFISEFQPSREPADKFFERRILSIPYRICIEAAAKPFKLLYINFLDLESSFNDLFEEELNIQMFCEIETSGCLERRCLENNCPNFVFLYSEELKEVLIKIGVMIQLLGYSEALPLSTFCIKLQEREASNGVVISCSVNDLVVQKAVHELAQAMRNPQIFLHGRSPDQVPPDYFRNLFGIPEVDNNDVAITPAIKPAGEGEVRITTNLKAFIKLSELANFSQNEYLNYTDYVSQVYTPEPCYVVSAGAEQSWIYVGLLEHDNGNLAELKSSGAFNYSLSVESKSSTNVAYQPETEIMANIWCPIVIEGALLSQEYISVDVNGHKISGLYDLEKYEPQVARNTQDKLDFQVPGMILGLILAQTGALTKVMLSAIIETIDNDSEDYDEYPFTEVHDKPTFVGNDCLLIENMKKYARVEKKTTEYEPLQASDPDAERFNPEEIDKELRICAPNYDKRKEALPELKKPYTNASTIENSLPKKIPAKVQRKQRPKPLASADQENASTKLYEVLSEKAGQSVSENKEKRRVLGLLRK